MDIADLEKRLANTEAALIALWSLTKDTMPQEVFNNTDNMMNEYFDANESYGSNFNIRNGFKHKASNP